jgi:hypothetical protein
MPGYLPQPPSPTTEFDLVGFSITPIKELTKANQEDLDLDLASLLSAVAFPPTGVVELAFDLRYLAIYDNSITGKQLVVALLCRLTFSPGLSDPKAVTDAFRHEFHELLSLHLEDYDYIVSPISQGDIWRFLEPFAPSEYVEIFRRVTRLRPLRMSSFQGHSPMSRAVDMLLRQPGQFCYSVNLQPYQIPKEISRELEMFGYDTPVLASDERDLQRDMLELGSLLGVSADGGVQPSSSTPYRMTLRVSSDKPISQYVINLLGAEVSGRRDYAFHRAEKDEFSGAITALRDARFFATRGEQEFAHLPESLRNLRRLFHVAEAQAAFRLPAERIATSRQRTFKIYTAPIANLPREGILLGHAEHPSHQEPVPVRIKAQDRRRHVYIVGKTGTGKSMLLLNMIKHDIETGKGVCVVDPHGDLVNQVLAHIPPARSSDLILFDVADTERSIGLNFIEATSKDESEKDFLVQEVIAMVMRTVDYNVEMYGPMAQQMTRLACLTLMDLDEPATLVEIPRLFANTGFREGVLRRVKDDEIRRRWDSEWEGKTEYQKHEILNYFTSKFEPFVNAPAVRNVVGQTHSAFDFKDVMDRGLILLVNLSRGAVGALNSFALGGMVISKLTWAAMRRAREPEEARRDFYLYVDEFQNFISDSFDTILSEARKYHLNLIIAHQHLGQLTAMGRMADRIERSVFGNVGTMAAFRVGTDAHRIADELGVPVTEGTLRSLQNRYFVAQLLVDDVPTTPFTVRTADYLRPSVSDEQIAGEMREHARLRNFLTAQVLTDIRSRWDRLEGR